MNDVEFLQWIHDRLLNVYGANKNVDYMHKLRSVIKNVKETDEQYYKLIWAVANKYESETRHETALRYIIQAEQSSGPFMSKKENQPPPQPPEPERTGKGPREWANIGGVF